MTKAELAAYNFLANKLEQQVYQTLEEFEIAKVLKLLDKRCIVHCFYNVVLIDTKEIIATVWKARDGFEWIKTVNDDVVEHYRRTINDGNFGVSLDLQSGLPLEYYVIEGLNLVKYDIHTKEKTGLTTECSFNTLPLEYKEKLLDYCFKDNIIYWADKPYGKIVGVLNN